MQALQRVQRVMHESVDVAPTAPARAIRPPAPGLIRYFAEVWANRHLLGFFSRRMMQYRSKRAIFGWFWLLLRSLLWVLPFSFVVGSMANVPTEGVPLPLIIVVGLSLWNFYSSAITFITRSLRYDYEVIDQLCLPHMLLPISSIGPVFLEFVISMLVVYGTGLYFYAKVGIFYLALQEGLLLSLVFVSLSVMLALGIGFFTCVFDYYATDTRFVVPHLLSFWMLATPVIYPLSAIPEPFRWLAWLNPMTAIVEGYRRCMLGVGHLDVLSLSWSVASTLLVFLVGAWFFVRALRHISIRA